MIRAGAPRARSARAVRGERRAQVRSGVNIEEYDPHSTLYVKQQKSALDAFSSWLVIQGLLVDLSVLFQAPKLAGLLLRSFGVYLFNSNSPLYPLCLCPHSGATMGAELTS